MSTVAIVINISIDNSATYATICSTVVRIALAIIIVVIVACISIVTLTSTVTIVRIVGRLRTIIGETRLRGAEAHLSFIL